MSPEPRSRDLLDQNASVYCPRCGTEINDLPCPVCGATADVITQRAAVSYAGFWLRVGATVADGFILLIPGLGAFLIGDAVANADVGTALSTAVNAIYLIGMLSLPSGQTIGNRIVGTRVRDAVTGQRITRAQAIRRWLPYLLYSLSQYSGGSTGTRAGTWTVSITLLALVDFLYSLMNDRRQTLHDRLAGTVVLRG
jgi:uncharacterized RDD family membrane protein YckC